MKKYIFAAGLMLAILAQTFLVAGAQDKEAAPTDKTAPKVEKTPSSTTDKEMKYQVKVRDKYGKETVVDVNVKKKGDKNELSDAEIERLLEMAKDKGPLGAAAREHLRNALGAIDRMALLPTDEPYQDFIYLDDSRPLLVRAHIQVGGKPVGTAWNEFVTELFRTGDADKDGFLSQKEFERIPSLDQILSGGPSIFGGYRGMNSPMTFGNLDANGDGKISLAEFAAYVRKNGFAPFQVEAPRDDNPAMRFGLGIVDKEPSIEAVGDAIFKLLDTNRDGKITREELAAAADVLARMDTNEDEMLTTREIAPDARGNSGKAAMMGGMMGRGGPKTGNANGNGKILVLKNGEAVNMSELTVNSPASPYGMAMKTSPADQKDWATVAPTTEKKEPGISEVARRLQERYSRKGKEDSTFLGDMIDGGLKSMGLAKVETAADKARNLLLSRADIGLDEATFALLDANKDGRLDAKELALFGKRTPDVELVVRLGSRNSGQDKVEVMAAKALEFWPSLNQAKKGSDYLQPISPAAPVYEVPDLAVEPPPAPKKQPKIALKTNDKDEVTEITVGGGKKKKQERLNVSGQKDFAMVDLGKTRTELRGKDAPKTDSMASLSRQQSAAQFKRADQEGNGYLTEKDAERNGFGGGMFKAMDRDGDGKVTEKEFYAYLDMIADLQTKARQASVTLVLSDESRGLFTLIDANRDGKLSVRELRDAVKLLATLDRGGKGYITRADVPKVMRLTLRQGPASNGDDSYGAQIAAIYGISMTDEEEAPSAGPAWFRKMDRNRDGDVSLGEWLGSEELFRRIDTDGDGLISVREAEAYDAAQRQKK